MKYIFYFFLFIVGCAPVPSSIDGMIVKRPDGTDMKIVCDNGKGNSYLFYSKVLVISQNGDTATEWRLIYE